MDWLAGPWNGDRGGREVERLLPGQAVAVEAGWGSYQEKEDVGSET
jgi:hypothetical protein